jgi:hypothetical protein
MIKALHDAQVPVLVTFFADEKVAAGGEAYSPVVSTMGKRDMTLNVGRGEADAVSQLNVWVEIDWCADPDGHQVLSSTIPFDDQADVWPHSVRVPIGGPYCMLTLDNNAATELRFRVTGYCT